MFKYVTALVLILICLVVLQHGCQGFGERFRKRMDEFRERRQEAIDDRKERWDQRFHRGESDEDNRFGHRWRDRRNSSDLEGDSSEKVSE
jgi:hypothetical protein